MESKAKFLGHAIHPILIIFPLGLLTTGAIVDVIYLMRGNPTAATVAFWMIAAGIIGGIAALPFGWIDWFVIPAGTRAKSIGSLHGIGNLILLLLFAASWWLRYEHIEMYTLIYILSFAGAGLAVVTGWLGGELVDRLGVGIDDGTHLNSSNSLSGQPAGSRDL